MRDPLALLGAVLLGFVAAALLLWAAALQRTAGLRWPPPAPLVRPVIQPVIPVPVRPLCPPPPRVVPVPYPVPYPYPCPRPPRP